MYSLASLASYHNQPLSLSLHYRPRPRPRLSFSRPICSLSFTPPPPPPSSNLYSSSLHSTPLSPPITAAFSSSKNLKPQLPNAQQSPLPFFLLKTSLIAAVTASALFLSRFTVKLAVAAPISPPSSVESSVAEANSDQEKEKEIEEYLNSHPEDIKALRTLMELKIKNRKIQEAILVIDQLIKLEPEDNEWPLMKAHLHSYGGDNEQAKLGFNEILLRDPLRVEAYHGLVMAASQEESDVELKEVEKRVVEGLEKCKKEKKKEDVRDFKLLLAQIRVIEGEYNDALKIYQELVKEEPRDFRPYLCQGIIYTLLRKNDDAEKNFQKYRRLVPKGHPHVQYFDENMVATKLFAQKVENENTYSKR